MVTPDLAPKGIGEILDSALALLRRHWRVVFAASAIVLFPAAFIVGTLNSFYLRGFLGLLPELAAPSVQPPDALFDMSVLANVVNAASSMYMLVSAFFTVAMFVAVPALLYGKEMRPLELLKGGWRRLVWYVLAVVTLYLAFGIIATVAAFVSVFTFGIALLAILPAGAWLFARLSMTPVVAVAEEANPIQAIKRSWSLTSGSAWRIVGFAIGVAVLVQVFVAAVSSPAIIRQVVDGLMNAQPDNPLLAIARPVPPGWKIVEGFLSAAAATLSAPFGHVAWYLFYLDLRSRRDGMDLVVRASALAEATA